MAPGRYLLKAVASGFADFEASAREVAREKIRLPEERQTPGSPRPRLRDEPGTDFQITARLVEAHVTVTEGRGRYCDGLGRHLTT